MTSPSDLAATCQDRASKQSYRIQNYQSYANEYFGRRERNQGAIRAAYADGRPALQDLSDMRARIQGRPGAPNLIKPIIDDSVAVSGLLPTITFDPKSESKEDQQQAVLCSRAVRGQYEQSQMDVGEANAVFFNKLFGEVCFTLDPLRPADAKKTGDPFALPGVYINVQNPGHCFPRFGTGRDINRIQDLFLYYRGVPLEEIEGLYPDSLRALHTRENCDIIVFYSKDEKRTLLQQGHQVHEVYAEDHNYGFCPAEWAINKPTGDQFGVSEIDQAIALHKNTQALFHLGMDSAIYGVFPILHVHNAEHAGRTKFGPGAVIETSEDGKVEMIMPGANSSVASMLLSLASDNLLKQTGKSPLRLEQNIQHSNTSGRAFANAQGPEEAHLAMSNTLLGSTLQWMNAKIAMILYIDPGFKNAEMSVYGADFKGQRSTVTFHGKDLGGLWRNHVKWPSLLGGNEHEQLVMALQLFKENLISGRKVLETIGEDDPERVLEEAHLDMKQRAILMQAIQQAQQGPPPSGPTAAADQGVALGAGAMPGSSSMPSNGSQPVQGGPAQPGPPPPDQGMPPFRPIAAAPGGAPGGKSPIPDIWGLIQQVVAQLPRPLRGEIVNAVGMANGISLEVTDQGDVPLLRTALKQVAETVAGPGAKVEITVAEPAMSGKGR